MFFYNISISTLSKAQRPVLSALYCRRWHYFSQSKHVHNAPPDVFFVSEKSSNYFSRKIEFSGRSDLYRWRQKTYMKYGKLSIIVITSVKKMNIFFSYHGQLKNSTTIIDICLMICWKHLTEESLKVLNCIAVSQITNVA